MVKVNEHVAAVQYTKRAEHRAIVVNTAQADTCMGIRVVDVCVYDRTALHAGAVFFSRPPEFSCMAALSRDKRGNHGLLLKNSEHRVVPY